MTRSKLLRGLTAVVAALVVATGGTALAEWTSTDETTVTGIFADAGSLVPGAEVRASGVRVGNVEQIELAGDRARVTLNLSPDVGLHEDARLTIRPVNLLGEAYVDLDEGSPSKPFAQMETIPLRRTSSRVSVQDVFNTFDDPTAAALATALVTTGEGMDKSGAEAAAAIKALRPAMARTSMLARLLRRQNGVLTQLLERVQPVAAALARGDGRVMGRLVGSTKQTLSTVAAEQHAFDQTLVQLPSTLATARQTLTGVSALSAATTPTLRSMRPVTDRLPAFTAELHRFADAADPAIASLTPVLRRANPLLVQAAPVVARLRSAGPDLRGASGRLRPLADEVLHGHLGDLMAFVRKWALSTNSRDALSHYVRGVAFVTPATLNDLAGSVIPGHHRRSAGPVHRLPDLELPRLHAPPTPVPRNVPAPGPPKDHRLPGLQTPRPRTPRLPGDERVGGTTLSNATGLTARQEQALVGQLLGGM